jgi:trans-aconitate methyltransferase
VGKATDIEFPSDMDWRRWIKRWDRMQDRYIVSRTDRFDLMVQIVGETQQQLTLVLDLGCGTGSLMLRFLERFPQAHVWGIDFDRTLLVLAEKRLSMYGQRAHLVCADLRSDSWLEQVGQPIDAAVSATALHWLNPEQLFRLYNQLSKVLHSGGIFLNSDHARNCHASIQELSGREREQMLMESDPSDADDWEGFWSAYSKALGIDLDQIQDQIGELWEGSEEGLPLEWHFSSLKKNDFSPVDCFWRLNCDAVYGGIRR